MKRIFKITAIFLVVAVIFGCHEEPEPGEPHAPTLIAPENGAELDSGSIIMIWSSSPSVDHYEVNMIVTAGVLLDTLTHIGFDTTLTVEVDTTPGTVKWKVATITDEGDSLWSETWSFTVNKSTEPTLDLDTTYFPFGMGYEWCYERYNGYSHSEDTSWYYYDTFTTRVTDSFWQGDTLIFYFGSNYPVWIRNGEIFPTYVGWVKLIPEPYYSLEDGIEYSVAYSGDTVTISRTEHSPYVNDWYDLYYTVRLRELGTIKREESFYHNSTGIVESGGHINRLLYFYNGQDTVYKAD